MSLAWRKFNKAIFVLAGPGSQRDRLFDAYVSSLIEINKKDLPAQIQPAFEKFRILISNGILGADAEDIKTTINALNESQIEAMVADVIWMHDVVTRYQPVYNAPPEELGKISGSIQRNE